MIRLLFLNILLSFFVSVVVAQYDLNVVRNFPTGSPSQLFSTQDRLYFTAPDSNGVQVVYRTDERGDGAEVYYRHQVLGGYPSVSLLAADENFLYFNSRKTNSEDNVSYLHRLNLHDGAAECVTDEVILYSTSKNHIALLENSIIFIGKPSQLSAERHYYSVDLVNGEVTPLIHHNVLYDYIHGVRKHTDGLAYIYLRLTGTNNFHHFVTDGTIEGTTDFFFNTENDADNSLQFDVVIDDYIYFHCKLEGEYLGYCRSKGRGHPIEPFPLPSPSPTNFNPHLVLKDKFAMFHESEFDMHLRLGEVDMTSGAFVHCNTIEDYFVVNDYIPVNVTAFVNKVLLIRNYNFNMVQGFITDCSGSEPYSLPFGHGEEYEIESFERGIEAGGVLYIYGTFRFQGHNNAVRSLIAIKPSDLSITNNVDEVMNVFPSPTANKINVNSLVTDKIYIFNAVGNLVYECEIKIGVNELDVQQLHSGIYLIKSLSGKSGKFIKQ